MTENQKPQGTNAHPEAKDHPSMDHQSMDDHANIHPDPAQASSEHGAMHHPEIESALSHEP